MKVIFAVNHPSQFHMLKGVFRRLGEKQHDVVFVIKGKDILADLMRSEQVNYFMLTKKRVGKSRISILIKGLIDILAQDFNLLRYVLRYKPELMVGTDYSITHVGRILNIPSIVFNEDDYSINKFFCRLAYPFASFIVAPQVCDVGKYEFKKISYQGYQKLSYLHPNVFKADPAIVKLYIPTSEKYFLIRLVSFSAGHDIEMNHSGIDEPSLLRVIKILEPFGKVFITSELKIPESLLDYKLAIDVKHMHHLLAYASILIADSQSMIVEAAMLGVPSIRYNSFVGKISVLEELEKKYKLTKGIPSNNPELLLQTIREMLSNSSLMADYQQNRMRMLGEKIDVSSFITWLIENYPDCIKTLRENPDYQYKFK